MSDNIQRIAIMKQRLTAALAPQRLTIVDDSAKHIGHPGAANGAGHFTLIISAAALVGKSRLTQHRLIYNLFADLIPDEIHALRIQLV